ncbi:MAG: helix-turn-helix domain-containing protein [Puniceicoccales bacterium]|jgi:transcriptional regulator with XRE-family HTH domain|nr:helix-turn-helix domain-containing protein [Puniceicoccales bacterium]
MANAIEQEGSNGFGLRFRLLMGYHDLTLRDISAATGAAVSTVSTWRNGRIPSARQTVESIAHLFKVSPAYLIYGITQNIHQNLINHTPENNEIPSVESYIAQKFERITQPNPTQNNTLRQRIERYLAHYLDQAERFEGGLEHMWIQLLRDFPTDWFAQNEHLVERKQLPQ